MKTVFLRVVEAEDKAAALLNAVREPELSHGSQRVDVDPAHFASVPRSPFAYWVSDRVRAMFLEDLALESAELHRIARRGAGTNDDFRFLRLWFEVGIPMNGWVSLAKGGVFSKFYASLPLVLGWREKGAQMRAFFIQNGESPSRNIRSESEYGRPGLTWPLRTTSGLSMRAMPAGCIFGHKGPAVFVNNDNNVELLALLAVTNSQAFALFVSLQLAAADAAARSYEVGVIQTTPVPSLEDPSRKALATLALRAWALKRSLDTQNECSHALTKPALLQVSGADLGARVEAWWAHLRTVEAELVDIQTQIDDHCFALYGIGETDRPTVMHGFGSNTVDEMPSDDSDDADESADWSELVGDAIGLVAALVSWAVGAAFGRMDIRLATDESPSLTMPAPFDPLPLSSPGMLTGEGGLPLVRAPEGYPLEFPESGILVDEAGHPHDLIAAVRVVFELVFDVNADRWLYEVAATLETTGHDLRTWLTKSFFDFHLREYSKSRRRAPIIWQLSTSSGRYSVFLYAHRLTRDTFFQLQTDVVGPKLALEERRLTSLIQTAGIDATASQRREIDEQKAVVEEVTGMLDDIKRIAPLWSPNLDDGIVLTMAPLWRLVPQHRSWQKELKTKWDELIAGKYDWAHLAMHLWPERVVPKCATDRSLAIAHGLEEFFWIEGPDGKWTPRTTPLRTIEDLIRERNSPAVKAALSSLIEAPSAQTGATRARVRTSGATSRGDRH